MSVPISHHILGKVVVKVWPLVIAFLCVNRFSQTVDFLYVKRLSSHESVGRPTLEL